MDRSIIEEIHEKYPEENKRAKREIGEDDVKMKIENENITDTNEQTQIMILFINPLDNTTVDLTSVYENIEEQYFDEMKHTVTILKHVMQFLKYLYDETEDDDNNQYSEIIFKDTTHPLESNSVHQLFENEVEDAILEKETNKNQKRIPRHVTDNYGEPEPQMEERMSTFGRNIRPPHFSPLDRQKFDHAFKNAKQSMFNLKHGLKPQIPAFTPGLKDLALKDKLLKQKLKTEGFRQKMKMDLKGKFGRLVKRDTEIPSNELSSINTDFPKSCESKTVEIFKTPRSKICTKKLSNDDNAEEPIKGFKRYKYSPIWDKNFNDMSHEDYDSTSIRNDLQKRSYPQEDMEDDNFDLIAEGSSNSWSWENIKCKLGFCEKNQLQEVVDNLTKLYNNLSDKASEIWRTLNN